MADTKVSALTPTAPVLTDLTYGVDDPGGTPTSVSFTLQGIMDLFEANIVLSESNISDLGTYLTAAGAATLSSKTIDGDSNTISNLDIGNEVDWAAATDVSDASAFTTGDKVLIFEDGVGLRKVDYDDLPGAGGGLSNIVEDVTPQLGGNLDVNTNGITFPGATVTDVTGADTTLVSGTAGTTDQIAVWNADGDLVGTTAGVISGLTEKATPASGDFLVLSDTAASGVLKKVDWATVQPYDANLPTWPATVDATEVGYLNGVTSAIQTQLNAKLADVVGDTTPTLGGDLDGAGNEVANYTNSVVTSVSGTLTTAAHAGNVIVTSGNVTVPTTAGFTCIIIAGGAHTVTFNSTTSAAMAAGDLMTVAVESGTVIHAVLTASANKVSFT